MIIGVVPARGGSKGIPRKNLATVNGRTLISFTLDAALGSNELDRVIVSTDDEEIASVARTQGCEVPFMRPAELATDDTSMQGVLRHVASQVSADAYCLLQPTSPLRTAQHIDEACAMFRDLAPDSVVSVVPVPHRYLPGSLMVLTDGTIEPLDPDALITRRQDKPQLYARNGPAILVISAGALDGPDLYRGRCVPYVMDEIDSCDVDDEQDLRIAGALLRQRTKP